MARFVKVLDKTKTVQDVEVGGTMSSSSWEGLKPFLEEAFLIKNNEKIIGLIATETGIQVRIETIKQR